MKNDIDYQVVTYGIDDYIVINQYDIETIQKSIELMRKVCKRLLKKSS